MDAFTIAGIVVVVVLSITSHEAAHAWVADRLGDPTARLLGRVTLNPVPHIDPFFTLLLPGFLILSGASFIFGGAKPVPVDLRRLGHPRRDWALVGAAGPLSNLLIGVLLAGLLAVFLGTDTFTADSVGTRVLAIGIYVNVLLMVINLIPIPPLDGSRVVQYFLTPRALEAYHRLEQFGLFILLFLFLVVTPFKVFLGGLLTDTLEMIASWFGIWNEVNYALVMTFSGR